MRPPPCTAEFVEAIATRTPKRPAFREDGVELNYAQLAGIVLQAGLYLRQLGVQRGERIAVSGPGFGIQLALLLAAEALGAVTVSFHADDDPDARFLFGHVERVFSARPQQVPAHVSFHRIDEALAAQFAQPLGDERPRWQACGWHEPQRLTRTSGSSGAAKFMVLTRQTHEWWIQSQLDSWTWGMDGSARLLLLSPLVIHAGYARANGTLRRGGMVMVGAGREIASLQPTHVLGLPTHLEALLADVPAGWRSPRAATVATFGGTLAPALRERAQAVFGGVAYDRYGSNEAGVICDELDENGTGVVVPGVDVRIVDEAGRELPVGSAGMIAVRSPCLVSGYIDRAEESAAVFRDGWFVSGDAGMLLAPRVLRLLGRHDDLISLGGIKLPAVELEQALLRQLGVRDAAVLAVHLDGGAVHVGVALVPAEGVTPEQAQAIVREGLPVPPRTPVRLLCLPALPRLASGKVDRLALLRMLA